MKMKRSLHVIVAAAPVNLVHTVPNVKSLPKQIIYISIFSYLSIRVPVHKGVLISCSLSEHAGLVQLKRVKMVRKLLLLALVLVSLAR